MLNEILISESNDNNSIVEKNFDEIFKQINEDFKN